MSDESVRADTSDTVVEGGVYEQGEKCYVVVELGFTMMGCNWVDAVFYRRADPRADQVLFARTVQDFVDHFSRSE